MSYSNNLCSRSKKLCEVIQSYLTVIVDRSDLKVRSLFFTENLPGNNVRMVLHGCDQHLVAFSYKSSAIGVGHEIDCFGCAANKNDFPDVSCIQKPLHGLPRCFMCVRRLCGEVMYSTMNVGVLLFIVAGNCADHGLGLLRCGRIIEVHQFLAVDWARKNGEIVAYAVHIEFVRCL